MGSREGCGIKNGLFLSGERKAHLCSGGKDPVEMGAGRLGDGPGEVGLGRTVGGAWDR